MLVKRIDEKNLNKMLNGTTTIPGTCVVKFYSNNCHLCHNLKDYYDELANSYDEEGLYFYAFNLDDNPKVEGRLGFKGVPTIILIKINEINKTPTIKELMEPHTPNEHTWYSVKDIKDFINKEK